MNKVTITVLMTAATLAAPAVVAQDGGNEGFYLGAGLGNVSSEIDDIGDVDLDFDEDEDATRLFAGWQFNRFFSVQVDRYDFSDAESASNLLNISTDTKGWAPSVVGTLPVGPVELSARVGMIWYDVEISLDDQIAVNESGEDPVYAVGLGFTVLNRLNLKLEYEVIEISEYDDTEAAWVSAAWRF